MKNRIAGYRKMLGFTQGEMAKKLDISKQAYWSKEKGQTPFSDDEKVIIKGMLVKLFPSITIDDIFFADKVS